MTPEKFSYSPPFNTQTDQKQIFFLIFAIFIFTIAWLIPNGKLFLYPLSLLATWLHEFGHALAAIIVGGKVGNIQISTNLSGMTSTAMPVGASLFKQAFMIAGGPVMAAIIGALMIMSGRTLASAKVAVWILITMITITVIAFGMNSTGMAVMGLIALGLGYAAIKLDEQVMRLLVHIIGIQGVLSIFSNFHYLARTNVSAGGRPVTSDSQLLANLLGTSQQFWAFSLTAFSIIITILAFLFSFGYLFKTKKENYINF